MKTFMVVFLLLSAVLHVESAWIKEMENSTLFEGDIILHPDEINPDGSVSYAMIGGRWPNPVPYEFGRDIARRKGKKIVLQAMEQYHKYTCIRFKPRTNEKSYMRFIWAPGCAAPVGHRPGKVSKINLDSPCWNLGIVMHEMGHALGLWHEQSRPDRDDNVKILWDNIKPQHKHNFNKNTWKTVESLGTPYDLSSMMHYGTTAFSSNGDRTIQVLDYSKRLLIGQRRGFSNVDVQELNLMYKCPAYKGTVPPKICKDSGSYDCAHFKKQGYCHAVDHETWMYRDCCKTCFGHAAGGGGGTYPPTHRRTPPPPTKPTKPGECVDKMDKSTCRYWESLGKCKSTQKVLRDYMHKNCCATCKAHHG